MHKSYILVTLTTIILLIIPCTYLYAQSQSTSVYTPKKLEIPLNNPLMGWAPSAEYLNYDQPHSLVYVNLYWNEIEPTKGQYDWEFIENKYHFNTWKSKNVRLILRLIIDYPSADKQLNIPTWLYDEIDGDGTWYDISYGVGFSPNYDNEQLILAHDALIKALGNRYNDDPSIAFIALGSLGHWGEWHTDSSISFVSEVNSKRYIESYQQAFPNKSLLLRTPNTSTQTYEFGLFNDMLGDATSTEDFLNWVDNGFTHFQFKTPQPPMKDFWKTRPSGGEFANGNSGLNYLTKETIKSTLTQIKRSHITFIGPNCPANQPLNSERQVYLDDALKTMGYRFVITQTKLKQRQKQVQLQIELENQGVAPIYEDWPVKLLLLNELNQITQTIDLETQLTNWLPGSHTLTANFSLTSSSGPQTLAIAILDPATNQPGIHFANDEEILPYIYKIATIN